MSHLLIVIDTVTERRNEAGKLLNSEEQLEMTLSGLKIIPESYSYELSRYTGTTKTDCINQYNKDLEEGLKPIGNTDFDWKKTQIKGIGR